MKRNVFERSANRNNGNNVANCNAGGNLNNNNANNGNYCAPDCVARPESHGSPEASSPATQRKEPPSRGADLEQLRDGRAPGPRAGGASGLPIIDLEDVIGYDALLESALMCLHGVMWKGGVSWFYLHLEEQVGRLCDELHAGTYVPRPCGEFRITYPKPRKISATAFRDRVVQRSYNDRVIYPCMSRSWIYDNYACQTGKGTDFARNRMRCHLERHLRDHGMEGGIGVVDVHGYYDHMLHSVANARFAAKCPPWAAEFARKTFEHQYSHDRRIKTNLRHDTLSWPGEGDRGFFAGSQLVQIAGVDYLDPIDHFVKERLGTRGYGRYMDDLVLVHEDMDYLRDCQQAIAERMRRIGLEAHPRKTKIIPFGHPFTFLGFDYGVRRGRVSMLVNPKKVKAQRRHMQALARLVRRGRMPPEDFLQSLACMLEHDGKGATAELVCRMRDYGETLLCAALRDRSN